MRSRRRGMTSCGWGEFVGWAKRQRAHHSPLRSRLVGGHASLCPPYAATQCQSPRVDARALAASAWLGFWHRPQPRHDPAPRLGGIDYLVDLAHRGDRNRLAVGIEFGDLGLVII